MEAKIIARPDGYKVSEATALMLNAQLLLNEVFDNMKAALVMNGNYDGLNKTYSQMGGKCFADDWSRLTQDIRYFISQSVEDRFFESDGMEV